MDPFSALLGVLGGVVGGVLAISLRLLHLEMEWHQVRTDLRKYYARMRADRPMDIQPAGIVRPALSPELQAFIEARRPGGNAHAAVRR